MLSQSWVLTFIMLHTNTAQLSVYVQPKKSLESHTANYVGKLSFRNIITNQFSRNFSIFWPTYWAFLDILCILCKTFLQVNMSYCVKALKYWDHFLRNMFYSTYCISFHNFRAISKYISKRSVIFQLWLLVLQQFIRLRYNLYILRNFAFNAYFFSHWKWRELTLPSQKSLKCSYCSICFFVPV